MPKKRYFSSLIFFLQNASFISSMNVLIHILQPVKKQSTLNFLTIFQCLAILIGKSFWLFCWHFHSFFSSTSALNLFISASSKGFPSCNGTFISRIKVEVTLVLIVLILFQPNSSPSYWLDFSLRRFNR